jgi:hypothetical protein
MWNTFLLGAFLLILSFLAAVRIPRLREPRPVRTQTVVAT